MKKIIIVLPILVVILFALNGCNNSKEGDMKTSILNPGSAQADTAEDCSKYKEAIKSHDDFIAWKNCIRENKIK
jgi:uncharacterized lipoprotein NlpE involved in copper resistance